MANGTVRVSFTVPMGTKAEWQRRAREQGISLGELIRRATSADPLAAMNAPR